jgi:long-chain acyl-CoA synthetase
MQNVNTCFAVILRHAECKYLFCGDLEQAEKVLTFVDELKGLQNVIVLSDEKVEHPKVILYSELLAIGAEFRNSNPGFFEKDAMSIKKSDLLTLIYTSGTTGEPKGVMLTHGNLTSNVFATLKEIRVDDQDIFLSFLPLSHVFERMAGHFLATSAGATICYAESIDTVADNMGEVHPTMMIAVPRFYEKVYAKVIDNISSASLVKKKLFWWSINAGKKAENLREHGRSASIFLRTKLKIANKLVFSKLQEKVGGKLRFFVSGGAPLTKEIGQFFKAAGILILEGYGLTETSPVISFNPLEKIKLGTVGLPLSNVDVQIAEDGEILTKGPHVMKGYFKDEIATREVLSDDGWLHTGDIGIIDDDGYLAITDRKKNIIVTSGGKNVAPQPMENVLVTSKWIEQILAIGDKRKFVSALIVPSFPNLEAWAKEKELKWETKEELIKLPEVEELYDRVIGESMEGFAQFEKVKKSILLSHEFTIESDELTPSMKIRRNIVEKHYAELINSMYDEVNDN